MPRTLNALLLPFDLSASGSSVDMPPRGNGERGGQGGGGGGRAKGHGVDGGGGGVGVAVGPRDSTAGGEALMRGPTMTASPGGTSSPSLQPSRDAAFAPPGEGAALLPSSPPGPGLSRRGVRGRGRSSGTRHHVEENEPSLAGQKRGSSEGPEPALRGDGGAPGGQDGRFDKRSRAITTDQPEQSPGVLSPDSHGLSPGAQSEKHQV